MTIMMISSKHFWLCHKFLFAFSFHIVSFLCLKENLTIYGRYEISHLSLSSDNDAKSDILKTNIYLLCLHGTLHLYCNSCVQIWFNMMDKRFTISYCVVGVNFDIGLVEIPISGSFSLVTWLWPKLVME